METPIVIDNLLQVWPEDLGEMNWDEATQRVKELGPGWRLPTIEEFENILYPNRHKIPELNESYYWSSSENDTNSAWSFTFLFSYAYLPNKYFTSYVRPVRDFTGEIAIELLLKEF